MNTTSKILLGSGLFLVCVAIIAFFILRYLMTKSFPVVSGNVEGAGVQRPVDIARDSYGVPHIVAQNEADLMFAAGYAHAQDRLWQMELTRRAGEGRLSEIFDTTTLRFDRLFRTLGFSRLADSLEEQLHPTSLRILEDYAKGVNFFIQNHRGKYPVEFDMLDFEPEPWNVRHSLLAGRMMAWELSFSWWADLTFAEISALVSVAKFDEITLSSEPISSGGTKMKAETFHELRHILSLARGYRDHFGIGPFSAGSNAWVVSGSRSMSGKPILANDPHLRISVPSKWYEMHLSAPGWNVTGMSIPGTPVIVIGHNDSIAWGLTNAMADDADFYIERAGTAHGSYVYGDTALPFRQREEMIYIGNRDSVEIHIRATHHGPVINDTHPMNEHRHQDVEAHSIPVSMRWTGYEMSDEIHALYLMNRATSAVEFEEGLKKFAVPAQSVMYADVAGNIGVWIAGRLPVREGNDPTLPMPGWTRESEWKGTIPFEDLPRQWNPPSGFIAAANQNVEAGGRYLSTLWEPGSRHERIVELLSQEGRFTREDFKRFQQDVFWPYARSLTPHLLHPFDHPSDESPEVLAATEYLRNWDYRCTATDVATTIFNVIFVNLLRNTLEDEMGPDVFKDFVYFSALPYRAMEKLLSRDSSAWFDDVTTPEIESKDETIRRSFRDAIAELKGRIGGEMKTWQWGTIHRAYFTHPFGGRKPLDRVFNVGPFPLGGSAGTVNKADYQLQSPYDLFSGPSMRQIVDLAYPDQALMVNTLGQSGQAMHPHYADQTALWLNGGYRSVSIRLEDLQRTAADRMRLIPLK